MAKIQAIEQYHPERVTKLPLAPPPLAGMLLFRDRTVPLINLTHELDMLRRESEYMEKQAAAIETRIVLVMEFNRLTTAAVVHGVNRIHRISWKDISPLSRVLTQETTSQFTGSVHLENREILILDMEKIVSGIVPKAHMMCHDAEKMGHQLSSRRPEVSIFLAEDSTAIMGKINEVLTAGRYTNVTTFGNGQEAYDVLCKMVDRSEADGSDIRNHVSIVISDIEMPQMDGLTLCRKIKKDMKLEHLPVVLFSSLINEQMALKCETVGADDYVSKPEILKLVKILDRLCLEKKSAAREAAQAAQA